MTVAAAARAARQTRIARADPVRPATAPPTPVATIPIGTAISSHSRASRTGPAGLPVVATGGGALMSAPRVLAERLNPLYAVLLAGAQAGDDDLRALVEVTERERMTGTGFVARRLAELDGLRPGLPVRRATEVLWALLGPELPRRLVGECGWSYDEYETWLADTLAAAVLR